MVDDGHILYIRDSDSLDCKYVYVPVKILCTICMKYIKQKPKDDPFVPSVFITLKQYSRFKFNFIFVGGQHFVIYFCSMNPCFN
jgi:hypothetical protein